MPTPAAVPFKVQRPVLLALTLTEVVAPFTCQSVTVGNATAGDLQIHTDQGGSNYLVVAAGFERVIWLPQPTSGQFRKDGVAFWLLAAQAGTVVLTWA